MIAATCIETVNAAATIILVGITAIYIRYTRHLVRHTADQADEMKNQVDEMREQTTLLKQRDADRARHALVAIIEELRANQGDPSAAVRRYFLDTAYASGLWALAERRMSPTTLRAIALAYKKIRIANAVAARDIDSTPAMNEGKDACLAINEALKAMEADDALLEFDVDSLYEPSPRED